MALFHLALRLPLDEQYVFVSRLMTVGLVDFLSPWTLYRLLAAGREPQLPQHFLAKYPAYRAWFFVAAIGAAEGSNPSLAAQLLSELPAEQLVRRFAPFQLAFAIDTLVAAVARRALAATEAVLQRVVDVLHSLTAHPEYFLAPTDRALFLLAIWWVVGRKINQKKKKKAQMRSFPIVVPFSRYVCSLSHPLFSFFFFFVLIKR